MVLWWLGNIVFLFVVIPVVVLLLTGLLNAAIEIRRYADDTLEHGVLLIAHLDPIDDLLTTRDLVKQASAGVGRYGAALDRIL